MIITESLFYAAYSSFFFYSERALKKQFDYPLQKMYSA